MNKLGVSLFLIATTLLTTACSNMNNSYDKDIKLNKSLIINNDNEEYLDKKEIHIKNSVKKSKTIKIPISIISKDINETKYLEIREDSSLQEKVELIIDTISNISFNGLPMKVTVYGENLAKVELIEFQNNTKNRVSWKEDYLNEYTKEYTINTIVKNILQEEYEGDWIEKVQLHYKGELIELN